MATRRSFRIAGELIRLGETRDIRLPVSQRYTGDPIHLPLRIMRARKRGPTLLITAAVHGDEINGTGVIHQFMFDQTLTLTAGTLILVPVVNIFGFEAQQRYMPDRRDLNRSFPGHASGSLTSRIARHIVDELISRADWCIDLHTAAIPRINYPNVRGDLTNKRVRRLARAFGTELIIDSIGPAGSLRREATRLGCPTIILEAGEPNKIEQTVGELGLRGIRNCLIELGMIEGEPISPNYQATIRKSTWVRAQHGGILRFHIAPGSHVVAGQPVATNVDVFGSEQNVLTTPVDGIVIGMTTLPTVKPGEPVCHIGIPGGRAGRKRMSGPLHQRIEQELATRITVSEHEGDWASDVVDNGDG